MKIKILLVLGLCMLVHQIKAQDIPMEKSKENHFGVAARFGVSTQVHSYPNVASYQHITVKTPTGTRNYMSEDDYGKYGEDLLPVWGLGINYTYRADSWFSIRPQLSYLQKGSAYRGHVNIVRNGNETSVSVGSNGDRFEFNNRFHYVAADLLFILKMNKWKTKPYFQTGLRGDLLVAHQVEYDLDEFSHSLKAFGIQDNRPSNTNYRDFNRFNYGLVTGFGVAFSKGWYLELNTDADFGFVVRNTDLKVRNYLASLTVGMRL